MTPASGAGRIRGLRPTGRGIAAIAVAAALVLAGLLLDRVELVYLGLVFVCAVAGAALVVALLPAPRRIAREIVTDLVVVGDPLAVTTTIGERAEAIVASEDLVSDGLAAEASEQTDPRVATATVVATRRGAHRVGPLRADARSPFGVVTRRILVGAADEILAVPPVEDLAPLTARGSDDGDRPARLDRHGQGSDNLIPRPYVPGDSMRRVHWRASAHHGDLMVREEERESTPSAVVRIDLDPASWDDGAFDGAMTALVSVVARLSGDGFAVDVEAADGRTLCRVATREAFAELLALTATLEPEGQGSAAPDAPGSAVVVSIGAVAPPPAAPGPHLLLASRPDVAAPGWRVAALSDDLAGSWASLVRGDAR
ncbi:MAG TPA: DUF58 domain-containing protein [Microbacterium sp.]|nr:DUF58 domain-containing protein [Microbacterium sp.]